MLPAGMGRPFGMLDLVQARPAAASSRTLQAVAPEAQCRLGWVQAGPAVGGGDDVLSHRAREQQCRLLPASHPEQLH